MLLSKCLVLINAWSYVSSNVLSLISDQVPLKSYMVFFKKLITQSVSHRSPIKLSSDSFWELLWFLYRPLISKILFFKSGFPFDGYDQRCVWMRMEVCVKAGEYLCLWLRLRLTRVKESVDPLFRTFLASFTSVSASSLKKVPAGVSTREYVVPRHCENSSLQVEYQWHDNAGNTRGNW